MLQIVQRLIRKCNNVANWQRLG